MTCALWLSFGSCTSLGGAEGSSLTSRVPSHGGEPLIRTDPSRRSRRRPILNIDLNQPAPSETGPVGFQPKIIQDKDLDPLFSHIQRLLPGIQRFQRFELDGADAHTLEAELFRQVQERMEKNDFLPVQGSKNHLQESGWTVAFSDPKIKPAQRFSFYSCRYAIVGSL